MHLPLKEYQERTLETLSDYYRKFSDFKSANSAFYHLTNRPYSPIESLSSMPFPSDMYKKSQKLYI